MGELYKYTKKFYITFFSSIYILISIITYGHAVVEYDRYKRDYYFECIENNLVINKTECDKNKDTSAVMTMLFVAPLWPLYWSVEFWDNQIPQKGDSK